MSGTSETKFTAAATVPNQESWGHYQRFNFSDTFPHVKLQAYSQFVPTTGNTSTINIETRNSRYAGFRFQQLSQSTDVNQFGAFYLQSFVSDGAGINIFGFVADTLKFYYPLSMESNKITNLATPTNPTDAANKSYVDGIAIGTITLTGNVTGSGTVGTPFATTIVSTLNNIPVATGAININSQDIVSVGKLGIGEPSPTFPLQFTNTIADCKIALYPGLGNSFQCYGFGVIGSTLKYSVPSSSDRHVFYCGASSTTSTELFRISGNGGINVYNILDMGSAKITSLATGVSSTDAANVGNITTAIAAIPAGTVTLTGNVTGSGAVGTPFATTIVSTLNQIPVATGAVNINSQNITTVANLGLQSISSPTFPLHFSNTTADCKIALYPGVGNSFQCYGFGVIGSTLKYSVDSSSSRHVFYCGASSTTSTELFRIAGTGYATALLGDGTFYSRVPSATWFKAGNASTTTAAANTWIKAASSSSLNPPIRQFTNSTNRITFTGSDLSANCKGMFSATVVISPSSGTPKLGLAVYLNGTSAVGCQAYVNPTAAGDLYNLSITNTMIDLDPGDYLEIWVLSSTATTLTVSEMSLSFIAC